KPPLPSWQTSQSLVKSPSTEPPPSQSGSGAPQPQSQPSSMPKLSRSHELASQAPAAVGSAQPVTPPTPSVQRSHAESEHPNDEQPSSPQSGSMPPQPQSQPSAALKCSALQCDASRLP